MKSMLLAAVVAAGAMMSFGASDAQARFAPNGLAAPSLIEDARCVTRRVRTVRPNGTVVFRTVRDCGRPVVRERCRTVRERVVRPGGRVVYREVRRCR